MKKFYLLAFILALSATIFAQNREWSIVDSYTIPGKASGLASDGQFIYFGIYGANGDNFYKFDPATGDATLLFVSPEIEDCFGLTYDGANLWCVDQPSGSSNPALASKLDMSGNVLETITLPDHYMSGIAFDAGEYWVGTYYPDPGTIYQIDASGAIQSQFAAPDAQPWDICVQDEFLWVVDYNANFIFKLDRSGNVVDGYDCENIKPSGIAFDGQYLWYADGELSSESTLYKVDLGGSGTPEISVQPSLYNYGNVVVNESKTLDLSVANNGTDELVIYGLDIPAWAPISSETDFPVTLEPNESTTIDVTYAPQYYGELNTTIQVQSSDPLNPEVPVQLMGFGVEDGPAIHITETDHNYGEIRINAYTRWFITIENRGEELLSIDDVVSDNPNFVIDEAVSFPIMITSRNTYKIGVWFHPEGTESYSGTISITNSDPNNSTELVQISGTGIFVFYPMGDRIWEYLIDDDYDSSPKGIETIADVTGDGVNDVIVCSEDDYVRCFNGNSGPIADVIWEKEIEYGNVYDQPSVQISDVNNDGIHDVIIGTAWSNKKVMVLEGKTGALLWEFDTQTFGEGGWVYMVDVSHDYNNDGVNDVLAATGNNQDNTGSKRVFCLDAATGDLIWQSYLGGAVFSVIGVDDITGDGVPDAVAGATDPGETQGYVYGINGTNGIQFWTHETSGSSVWALLQLDDINGDGVRDIVAGDFMGTYYLMDPVDGAVLNTGYINGTIILRFEALEDVDNDGYMDFTVAHSGSMAMAKSGFNGENIWAFSLSDKCWNLAPIPDISGDNIGDVVVGTLFSDNQVFFINGVDGSELMSVPFPSPIDALWVTDDIVGDGSWEVVVGGREGELYCLSGGQTAGTGMTQHTMPELEASLFPNPMNSSCTIDFQLENESNVYVKAMGADGKSYLISGEMYFTQGENSLQWDGKTIDGVILPNGIYLVTIYSADNQATIKVVKN